ncbi:alpha/beta fold hydrolase [Phytomonospora sp. NPDC050363]|uniref:thioesterase II family protein n=1 Tax=Phytomonospora sp. NPDC050363 TaxID=3155642 RepID=UPI0033ED480D
MSDMQLFCVPHAGGSATAFLRWRRQLPAGIEVLPVELAGRGPRIADSLVVDARPAGADVAERILAERRPGVPYAIWGHSMGSLIAYEAYYELRERTTDLPGHMIFSGRCAPHSKQKISELHKIADDDAFIAALDVYGGGTKEALADPGLRELFLPVLRADFELSETYRWTARADDIHCDVTVVNGRDDQSVEAARLPEWHELVAGRVDFRTAEGDHFFLHTNQQIVHSVVSDVHSALAGSPAVDQRIGKDSS